MRGRKSDREESKGSKGRVEKKIAASDKSATAPSRIFLGWFVSDVDRDWQFRMSLYYVKPEDANTFTCQTPRRQTNSVTVVVTGRENDS